MQCSEVWIGFMIFAGKRSNVDCLAGALAMNGWPDECDVLGAGTSNEGQFHYRPSVLVAIGLAFHPDLGALGWQD